MNVAGSIKPERLWDYPEVRAGLFQMDNYPKTFSSPCQQSEYSLLIFIPSVKKKQGWVLLAVLLSNLSGHWKFNLFSEYQLFLGQKISLDAPAFLWLCRPWHLKSPRPKTAHFVM